MKKKDVIAYLKGLAEKYSNQYLKITINKKQVQFEYDIRKP